MQLAHVSITKFGADSAVILNGKLIIIADPQIGDDADLSVRMADNLAQALGVEVENVEYAPNVIDWTWEGVIDALVNDNILVDANKERTHLYKTIIQDWMLSDGYDCKDIGVENCAEYVFTISRTGCSGAVEFSLQDKHYVELESTSDIIPQGLFGTIEIRDGVPAISLGLTPDSNTLHVISNGSSKMAVILENDDSDKEWMRVPFCSHKHRGLVITEREGAIELESARMVIVEKLFSEYDFGDYTVEESNRWEIDGDVFKSKVFLRKEGDLSDTVMGELRVKFSPVGIHVVSSDFYL